MMEIIVVALVTFGIYCFFGIRKMLRRNKDPKQQTLALMFIAASQSDPQDGARIAAEIGAFIAAEGWDRVEAVPRIAHALSMVKVMQPDIYENAIEISNRDNLWDKIRGGMNPMPQLK